MLASQKGYADVVYVAIRSGSDYYGAQFIANAASGFTSYFDPAANAGAGANTADAPTALMQFDGKKPCWTDPLSASGYVIPSGIVATSGAKVKQAAFVIGHPTVVRALYLTGICDFGATYIDARTSSSLKDLADVSEKVVVIWRTDPLIPNDTIAVATGVPDDVKQAVVAAFGEIAATEDGLTLLKNGGYSIGGLKVVAESGWFAARPSGTENIYKIYAESFKGPTHLDALLSEAQDMVNYALAGFPARVAHKTRSEFSV